MTCIHCMITIVNTKINMLTKCHVYQYMYFRRKKLKIKGEQILSIVFSLVQMVLLWVLSSVPLSSLIWGYWFNILHTNKRCSMISISSVLIIFKWTKRGVIWRLVLITFIKWLEYFIICVFINTPKYGYYTWMTIDLEYSHGTAKYC